jgi:hypothetical protein
MMKNSKKIDMLGFSNELYEKRTTWISQLILNKFSLQKIRLMHWIKLIRKHSNRQKYKYGLVVQICCLEAHQAILGVAADIYNWVSSNEEIQFLINRKR